MSNILDSLDLGDTGFNNLIINADGSADIHIDFDSEWNTTFPKYSIGLKFNYVYEILNVRLAGISFLSDVTYNVIEKYEKSSSEIYEIHSLPILKVEIENLTGDKIILVCADSIEFLSNESA